MVMVGMTISLRLVVGGGGDGEEAVVVAVAAGVGVGVDAAVFLVRGGSSMPFLRASRTSPLVIRPSLPVPLRTVASRPLD